MFALLRLGGSADLEVLVSTMMNSLSQIDLRRFLIESESAFALPDLIKCCALSSAGGAQWSW